MTHEYLAGLIDGEGYLALLPIARHKHLYHAVVKVAFREGVEEVLILNQLREQYGGYLEKRKGKGKHSPSICWTVKSKTEVRTFIEAIYPHLRIKRRQAELVLKYIETPSIRTDSPIYTASHTDRLHEIYWELRELKKALPATTE